MHVCSGQELQVAEERAVWQSERADQLGLACACNRAKDVVARQQEQHVAHDSLVV